MVADQPIPNVDAVPAGELVTPPRRGTRHPWLRPKTQHKLSRKEKCEDCLDMIWHYLQGSMTFERSPGAPNLATWELDRGLPGHRFVCAGHKALRDNIVNPK